MVLRRLPQLKSAFGLPLLVSVSRNPPAQAGGVRGGNRSGTLAAELYAALHGADMIRTHEPRPLRDALTICRRLLRAESDELLMLVWGQEFS